MTFPKILGHLGQKLFTPSTSFHDDFEDARLSGCYYGRWGTSPFYIDGHHDMYIGHGSLRGRLYDVIGANRARSLDTISFQEAVQAPPDSSRLLSGTDEIYTSERTYIQAVHGLDRVDTSYVTDMHGMFANDHFITSLDLSSWDVSRVHDFSVMFHNLSSLDYLNIADWDTGQVVDMRGTFDGTHHLKKLNVHSWDTSQVKDMAWAFADSGILRLDLSYLDMSRVRDTNAMFLWMPPGIDILINPTLQLTERADIQNKHIIRSK